MVQLLCFLEFFYKLSTYIKWENQGIITKEYQKRSKNSVSAKVVAILTVVTLIKDFFSHFMGPTCFLNTKVL